MAHHACLVSFCAVRLPNLDTRVLEDADRLRVCHPVEHPNVKDQTLLKCLTLTT